MSNIGWTDETWNPVTGCTRVSSGCDNCYAVQMTKRLAKIPQTMGKYGGLVNPDKNHFNGIVKCHEDVLSKPEEWKTPERIFVNSMSDLFHENVPFEFIDKVFDVMRNCDWHIYQVLTKRPKRALRYFYHHCNGGFDYLSKDSPHIWLGVSIEDKWSYDRRIREVEVFPTKVRFISFEPLIGDIPLTNYSARYCDWAIIGGESGKNHREMPIETARNLIEHFKGKNIPVFVKQDSGFKPGQQGRFTDEEWALKEFPE